MPYLIETYKPVAGQKPRLIDVNKSAPYENEEAANEAIAALNKEQEQDNLTLMGMYADRLESQVMDLDTDDRIIAPPHQYNYIYKAAFYGKRQFRKLPV